MRRWRKHLTMCARSAMATINPKQSTPTATVTPAMVPRSESPAAIGRLESSAADVLATALVIVAENEALETGPLTAAVADKLAVADIVAEGAGSEGGSYVRVLDVESGGDVGGVHAASNEGAVEFGKAVSVRASTLKSLRIANRNRVGGLVVLRANQVAAGACTKRTSAARTTKLPSVPLNWSLLITSIRLRANSSVGTGVFRK